MVKGRSRKHLLWLLPLSAVLLLVVVLAVLLGVLRSKGLHWQGLAWNNGPQLSYIGWQDGSCSRFEAEDVQLLAVWPLRLNIARLNLPACASDEQGVDVRLPPAPPFDITIQACNYQDYPALTVAAHHWAGHWWASASLQGSHVRADYYADKNAQWQLHGRIEAARFDSRLEGSLDVQGEGVWRPDKKLAQRRFSGQINVHGRQLGWQRLAAHSGLTLDVTWQGSAWTLDANLAQPVVLPQGWVVLPEQGVHASGHGLSIEQADVQLSARSKQANATLATLSLHSKAGRLGRGRGSLTLSDGWAGQIHFRWAEDRVVVQPFSVTMADGVELAVAKAITAPLARTGAISPAVTLHYDGVEIRSNESHLHWQPDAWQWRGTLLLGGRWQGYDLQGGWSGSIGSAGVHGEPVVVTLDNADLHVRAQLPVGAMAALDGPFNAQLSGRFRDFDFTATLSAAQNAGLWSGAVHGRTRAPQLDSGGAVTLDGQWQWRDGLRLASGARLHLTQAIKNDVLIRPATLVATTPVTISSDGIQAKFRLDAKGLVAARWELPSIQASLVFDEWAFDATAQVPQWGAELRVSGHDLMTTPNGRFNGQTALKPAISRGLGFVTRAGGLMLSGRWQAASKLSMTGRVQATDGVLDWGGVSAEDVQADLAVSWHDGRARISSRTPITVAKLDVGIPITAISLGLETNVQTWMFHDVRAALLGGHMAARKLTWPSLIYQPITLSGIDMAQLAALQNKPVVRLSGRVGGDVPLRLEHNTLAIEGGLLTNETPLELAISKTEGERALAQSHQAVGWALAALNPLHIKEFQARINMQGDGWLDAAMTIKGRNPNYTRPLVLHYTHQENMFKLLRSLRIGGNIVDAVVDKAEADSAPGPTQDN